MLIVGAGGVVGKYAIALAKRAGVHVIATASPRSADAVRAAGADEIIDHTATDVLDAVTVQVDLLLNLAPIAGRVHCPGATRARRGSRGEHHRLDVGAG